MSEEKSTHKVNSLLQSNTETSIAKFKNKVIDIAKTAEEYNELFSEDINLVIFVRRNIELNPLAVI